MKLAAVRRRVAMTLAVTAVVAWLMRFTAMPAVLDVSLIVLVLALLAAAMLAAGSIRARPPQGKRPAASPRGALVTVAAMLLLATAAAWERFASYRTEEIRFPNGEVELAGTLYMPRRAGPSPTVVFVHGSGPETRREYAYFAKQFARRGFAALAYDKRGTGESGGRLYTSDYHDYARDAVAAVHRLAESDRVNARCIGLVGFSEGEWTAPLAATLTDRIAFLIVIAPSGVSPATQVNEEIALRLRRLGYADADVDRALALNNRVFEYQRTGVVPDGLADELRQAAVEPWFQDADDIPAELYAAEDYRWWRSVMDFEPAPVWEHIRVPVLLLKGEQDQNSTADLAQQEIEAALRRGGNTTHDFIRFAGGDHMILRWPLGNRVPPPLFARGYPAAMVEWATARECAAP